jgi:hypothetical protein
MTDRDARGAREPPFWTAILKWNDPKLIVAFAVPASTAVVEVGAWLSTVSVSDCVAGVNPLSAVRLSG